MCNVVKVKSVSVYLVFTCKSQKKGIYRKAILCPSIIHTTCRAFSFTKNDKPLAVGSGSTDLILPLIRVNPHKSDKILLTLYLGSYTMFRKRPRYTTYSYTIILNLYYLSMFMMATNAFDNLNWHLSYLVALPLYQMTRKAICKWLFCEIVIHVGHQPGEVTLSGHLGQHINTKI